MRKQQFAVLGLGRFGASIVQTLSKNGYEVLACDRDPEVLKEISQYATDCVQVDITDKNALEKLDLSVFDCVIIAVGSNLESGVISTVLLKKAGVKRIIAKASTETQAEVLKMVGADKVVLPERDMGMRLAYNMTSTAVLDYISFSENMGIAEIEPKHTWFGKSLKELNIRAAHGINIVAIKRNDSIIVSPYADEKIQKNDILVVIGTSSAINKFS